MREKRERERGSKPFYTKGNDTRGEPPPYPRSSLVQSQLDPSVPSSPLAITSLGTSTLVVLAATLAPTCYCKGTNQQISDSIRSASRRTNCNTHQRGRKRTKHPVARCMERLCALCAVHVKRLSTPAVQISECPVLAGSKLPNCCGRRLLFPPRLGVPIATPPLAPRYQRRCCPLPSRPYRPSKLGPIGPIPSVRAEHSSTMRLSRDHPPIRHHTSHHQESQMSWIVVQIGLYPTDKGPMPGKMKYQSLFAALANLKAVKKNPANSKMHHVMRHLVARARKEKSTPVPDATGHIIHARRILYPSRPASIPDPYSEPLDCVVIPSGLKSRERR